MGNKVYVGKQVDYITLETALVKAAEKIGWKCRVKDEFDKNYRLGPFQESQDYSYTVLKLGWKVFPAMKVYIPNKNSSDSFFVWHGFPQGIASAKRVQDYLIAVSENL